MSAARRGAKKMVILTLIALAGVYVLVCLLAFLFQRSLTYPASREADIDPLRAGLSENMARVLNLRAADGIVLGAWHVLPAGVVALGEAEFDAALRNPAPVVLFFHGNGGHRGHRGDRYALLASLGCHAVAFDYRGYGDSAGVPSEDGLALDARAAWAWLTKEHGVPPGRIVLHGESLGCAVSIRLAKELCEAGTPPAGLVLEGPFTSLPDAAAAIYWFLPARLLLRETFPSLERIEAVMCPVLVMHGRQDGVVPFAHGQRVFEAAPAQSDGGLPKRFVEFPEGGHTNLRLVDERTYVEELRSFFEQCWGLERRNKTAVEKEGL